MRNANGMGTIVKLTGNRRRPYAIRKVIGWKEDGRPKLKYISYHRTKREAEQALKQYNEDPYRITKTTVAELYKEWYALQETKRADNTLKGYRAQYNHIAPLHDIKLKDIDRVILQNFYDNVDVSKETFKGVRELISMLIKYAVKRGILPISALNLTKAVNIPEKREVRQKPRSAINKADINRLWEVSEVNEYAKVALVYIYTGMRFSELQNLRPEDCHEDYVEIRESKTAAGIRIVPLSEKVKSLLPIIKVPSRTTFERHYKKLLPDHVIHDTRHTFISLMTETGCDPRIIKAIVGHKRNDITELYTHISLEKMLEAVNRL